MPAFTSPSNPADFNARVWQVVRQIPPGRVMAYGQVGALVPVPDGMSLKDYDAFRARWVGGAMAACPEGVPWWRVVNAQGKISPRPGAEKQRALLEAEGVVFDTKDRIDLSRFGWHPDEGQNEKTLTLF